MPKPGDPARLLLDLEPGQRFRLTLGEVSATVELVHKSGRVARLQVLAPTEVRVARVARAGTQTAVARGDPSMAESRSNPS